MMIELPTIYIYVINLYKFISNKPINKCITCVAESSTVSSAVAFLNSENWRLLLPSSSMMRNLRPRPTIPTAPCFLSSRCTWAVEEWRKRSWGEGGNKETKKRRDEEKEEEEGGSNTKAARQVTTHDKVNMTFEHPLLPLFFPSCMDCSTLRLVHN